MNQNIQAAAKAQARTIKKFLAEQGIELSHGLALECAARLAHHKNWATLLAATPQTAVPAAPKPEAAAPAAQVDDATLERVREAVAEALGQAKDCTRTWSAWGYNTMSQEDFVDVASDPERVDEIAQAAIDALMPPATAVSAPVARPPVDRAFEATRRAFWKVFCDDGDVLMHDLITTLNCAALNSVNRHVNAENVLQAKHGQGVVLNGPYDLLSCEDLSRRLLGLAKQELDRMPQ